MAFDWFRLDAAMVDHPKTMRLALMLKEPLAGWYVIRLWSWMSRFCPTGVLRTSRGTSADGTTDGHADIADVAEMSCGWHGKPGELLSALVSVGWLDELENGDLEAHDWQEKQGAAVLKTQKDAERKRKWRAAQALNALDSSAGRPRDGTRDVRVTARVRDETRRDETRHYVEALRETPPAPPLALVEQEPPAPKVKADPRLKLLTEKLVAIYAQRRSGETYAHGGAKDAQALKKLLPIATDEQIAARWADALDATGWASASTLAQLGAKWNDLAAGKKPPGDWSAEDCSGPIRSTTIEGF